MDHPPRINTKRPARRISGADVVEVALGKRCTRLVSLCFILENLLHKRTEGRAGIARFEKTDVLQRSVGFRGAAILGPAILGPVVVAADFHRCGPTSFRKEEHFHRMRTFDAQSFLKGRPLA